MIDLSFTPRSEDEIRNRGYAVSATLGKYGHNPKLSYAITELLRNAYEHGNGRDLTKKITFRQKINKNLVQISISDEGNCGIFEGDNYIKYLSEQSDLKNAKSFYDFNSINQAEGHGGVGLKMAKMFFDEVILSKNDNGGLVVEVKKLK